MNDIPPDPLSPANETQSSDDRPVEPQADARGPASGETNPPTGEEAETSVTPETSPDSQEGHVQSGKVMRVTAEQVFVELEGARQGFVPLSEFVGQPLPQLGDACPVIVGPVDSDTDLLRLSKRQAEAFSFWHSVQPGDVLEGVVTGMNKGGLDIDLGGARAFLPASQVDVHRMRDISLLIGEHIRCVVTQVDRTTRDIVVSRRKFMEKECKAKRDELLNALAEGQIRTGTVSKIADFGAFVNIGGIEGLVHITDISWARIRHPSNVLQEGQQIEVAVLKVNRGDGKISLGLKQVKPDPWEGIQDKYPVHSRVKRPVVRLADFGAFVKLEEDVEALLPISEMSWTQRINHPAEVLKVGDEPELVVLNVDTDKRRVSLGLKQTEENPWSNIESKYPANSKVRGKVSKIVEFGAFVELAPGVEGLVHISEVSEKRIRTVADILQEGREVEVRVLKVDPEAQRISLSMRPARQDSPGDKDAAGAKSAKKQRKRPLRGGLSSHFEW